MQTLLNWGLSNSTPEDFAQAKAEPRQPLDPGVIDAILGKPDAVLMREALEAAQDDKLPTDARATALDNLELLVESIDNANNLTPLNMWTPLLALLTSDAPEEVVAGALWVLGTAVQNNDRAQADFLEKSPIPTILSRAAAPSSPSVRAKALYVLSGALKHNARAVESLTSDEWSALLATLTDSSAQVRRKAAFLLAALLVPHEVDGPAAYVAQLTGTAAPARKWLEQTHGVEALVRSCGDEDEDVRESAARALAMYAQGSKGVWPAGVRPAVAGVVQAADGQRYGLDNEHWQTLALSVA